MEVPAGFRTTNFDSKIIKQETRRLEGAKMAKPGLLEAGTLFSQLGKIRRRHSLSSPRTLSSKSGRGLVLFFVTAVCSLLLVGRLLWCFMYLFTGSANEVYVEPLDGRLNVFEETETKLAKVRDDLVVRVWGPQADGIDSNEINAGDDWMGHDLLDPSKDSASIQDDRETKRLSDEEDGSRTTEVEKILDETAEMANVDDKLGDETLMEVSEKVTEEVVAQAVENNEEETADDEGALVKRKISDAMAYLERLAGKLAKTGKPDN